MTRVGRPIGGSSRSAPKAEPPPGVELEPPVAGREPRVPRTLINNGDLCFYHYLAHRLQLRRPHESQERQPRAGSHKTGDWRREQTRRVVAQMSAVCSPTRPRCQRQLVSLRAAICREGEWARADSSRNFINNLERSPIKSSAESTFENGPSWRARLAAAQPLIHLARFQATRLRPSHSRWVTFDRSLSAGARERTSSSEGVGSELKWSRRSCLLVCSRVLICSEDVICVRVWIWICSSMRIRMQAALVAPDELELAVRGRGRKRSLMKKLLVLPLASVSNKRWEQRDSFAVCTLEINDAHASLWLLLLLLLSSSASSSTRVEGRLEMRSALNWYSHSPLGWLIIQPAG